MEKPMTMIVLQDVKMCKLIIKDNAENLVYVLQYLDLFVDRMVKLILMNVRWIVKGFKRKVMDNVYFYQLVVVLISVTLFVV